MSEWLKKLWLVELSDGTKAGIGGSSSCYPPGPMAHRTVGTCDIVPWITNGKTWVCLGREETTRSQMKLSKELTCLTWDEVIEYYGESDWRMKDGVSYHIQHQFSYEG